MYLFSFDMDIETPIFNNKEGVLDTKFHRNFTQIDA